MHIAFRGGPYDGLRLSAEQVRRYTCPLKVHTHQGDRFFALLPRLADWDAVVHGSWDPGDRPGLYPYELVLTPGAGSEAEYRDAFQDGGFERAIDVGWLD